MSKKPRFGVARLFKRLSATSPAPVAVEPKQAITVESTEETQVEKTMAKEEKKPVDIAELRAEVELLELRVRKVQAREWLKNHKAGGSKAASK